MKFRSYVEPPEPMRGLEVPPEVVEALGGGKRPAVTITINGHSWKSRVAIMRGRYLLGLSNANRKTAGVVTGDEVLADEGRKGARGAHAQGHPREGDDRVHDAAIFQRFDLPDELPGGGLGRAGATQRKAMLESGLEDCAAEPTYPQPTSANTARTGCCCERRGRPAREPPSRCVPATIPVPDPERGRKASRPARRRESASTACGHNDRRPGCQVRSQPAEQRSAEQQLLTQRRQQRRLQQAEADSHRVE
jgi:hypothetical protein